jgi:hypothetical protein
MTDPAQTFKLYGPTGDIIMTGSMSAIMERIPDSVARNAALEDMLKIAADAVGAEERQAEARACAIRTLSDGVARLATRLDSFEKELAISMEREEAEQHRRDQQEVQSYLDALPDPDEPDELYALDPKEREASRSQGARGIAC